MRNFCGILILPVTAIFLIGISTAFAEEDADADNITLTTYYPSPYGAYDGLVAYRLAVGDTNNDTNLNNADLPINQGEAWLRGPVGIGTITPNPSYKLDVNGIINATDFYKNGVLLTGGGGGGLWAASGSNIYSTNTGNVKITPFQTPTWGPPAHKLSVDGALTFRGITQPPVSQLGQGIIYFDSTTNKLRASENGGLYKDVINRPSLNGWTDNGTIVRLTTNTDKVVLGTMPPLASNNLNVVGGVMIVDPSITYTTCSLSNIDRVCVEGNLGIGTSSPQTKLHVKGDIWSEAPTGNARRVSISYNTTLDAGEINVWDATAGTPKELIIQQGGDYSGLVGIGDKPSLPVALYVMQSDPADAFRVDDEPNDITPFVINQYGDVGIGTSNPTSTLYVNGTFTATGLKNFELPHPTKKGYTLTHSTIEGPEAAVFYRGEAKLTNGSAIVALPDYFEALTRKQHRTVQLTPKGKTPYLLSATNITDNTFQVFGTDPDGAFFWEVKAERSDVEPLRVEKNVQKEL